MSRRIFALVYALSLILAGQAVAGGFDFSGWDAILKENVKIGVKDGIKLNLVDYSAIKKETRFPQIVSALAEHEAMFADNKEKIAFWSNVYNILAIKMVIDNPGVKSIRDVGSFLKSVWKRDAGKVGGKTYSLDYIEHAILRKLGDPRIHGAIVCASVSCPDLRAEAYDAKNLDRQLDDQFNLFLASKTKGLRIEKSGGKIHLSKIFKWFGEDFKKEGGVRAFIAKYLNPQDAAFVNNDKNKIVYMDYNWKLNGN